MTLALLITAVTGAWAQEETLLTTITATSKDSYSETTPGVVTVTHDNSDIYGEYGWVWWANPGSVTVEAKEGYTITRCVFRQSSKTPVTVSTAPFKVDFIETANPRHPDQKKFLCQGDWKLNMNGVSSIEVYGYAPAPAADPDAIDVTTNAAEEGATFTEAWFNMPTSDVTADYELVRDMQDETNPVAFSGLPSSGNIVVKKGSDGKYQPAETLTLQLIDPLAAAEAQNIIQADGITVKVGEMVPFDIEGSTYYQLDKETLVPLADFLADMKPGLYKMVAESTDENSPYDGTVYSSQFTVVEQYDLTVKPANDFSKNGLDAVTVGSQSVTIDANTGKATKTGIDPETEVKIKAKRGYVIDKVEVKKAGPALKTLTVTGVTIYYAEGDTWQQAIERPENAGSGWKVQGNYIFNVGLTLFTNGGGATYVYVRPGDTIDATKNYSLEAD